MQEIGETDKKANPAARWYSLAVLMLVYVLNFVDRQIMGILLEPIRIDMELHDWQLGIIVGFGFAIMYSLLGLPIAVIAERVNRVKLVALALGFWSIMTALCGAAQNSFHLLLARIGVGLGEAGGSPPSQSLISDSFPANERARAFSIWGLGAPIGTAIGVIGGAWVAELYGWRMAFFAAGAPGVLVALLMLTTLKDKRKPDPEREKFSPALVLRLLWEILKRPSLLMASVGAGIAVMVMYTTVLWGPTYFIRQYGVSPTTISYFAALILGFASAFGTFLGGSLVHRLVSRWPTSYCGIPAIGFLLAAPGYWLALWLDNALASAIVLLAPTILFHFWVGPVFALFQNEAPLGERAMATAVLFMVVNLIGLGIGPSAVGIFSSYFQAEYGLAGGLRLALTVSITALIPAALLLFYAGRSLSKDAKQ